LAVREARQDTALFEGANYTSQQARPGAATSRG